MSPNAVQIDQMPTTPCHEGDECPFLLKTLEEQLRVLCTACCGILTNIAWQVGKAAPVIVAELSGGDRKATLSKLYGGKAEDVASAKADPVYAAIGQVSCSYLLSPYRNFGPV